MISSPISTIAGLAIFASSIASLSAQTISYQYSTPQSVTEINEIGNLEYFDSNLGILTGATLTVNSSMITQFSLRNSAVQTQVTGFKTEMTYIWSSSNSVVQSILTGEGLSNMDGGSFETGVTARPSGQVFTYGPMTIDRQLEVDLADYLSFFQQAGGGTFDLNTQSAVSNTHIGGGGNIDVDQATTAGVSATIVYTYIPVPETSSALLGLIGCSAGIFRRRRNG